MAGVNILAHGAADAQTTAKTPVEANAPATKATRFATRSQQPKAAMTTVRLRALDLSMLPESAFGDAEPDTRLTEMSVPSPDR